MALPDPHEPLPPHRFPLWAPVAGLVVLAAAYTGWWFYLKDQAVEAVGQEVEAWRNAGYSVDWTETRVAGFPLGVEVSLIEPTMSAPPARGGWSWNGEALRVTAPAYWPRRLKAEVVGVQKVRAPGDEVLEMVADGLKASLQVDARGLRDFSAKWDAMEVGRFAGVGDFGGAGEGNLRIARDPQDPNRYTLVATATGPRWPMSSPEGAPDQVFIDASISRTDVLVDERGFDPLSIGAWARAGGRLEIRAARMSWGEAAAELTGDLGLDDLGRIEGQVQLVAKRPGETISRFGAMGVVDVEAANQASFFAVALLGPDGEVTLPVAAKDGVLMLFGMRVGRVPAVY